MIFGPSGSYRRERIEVSEAIRFEVVVAYEISESLGFAVGRFQGGACGLAFGGAPTRVKGSRGARGSKGRLMIEGQEGNSRKKPRTRRDEKETRRGIVQLTLGICYACACGTCR